MKEELIHRMRSAAENLGILETLAGIDHEEVSEAQLALFQGAQHLEQQHQFMMSLEASAALCGSAVQNILLTLTEAKK